MPNLEPRPNLRAEAYWDTEGPASERIETQEEGEEIASRRRDRLSLPLPTHNLIPTAFLTAKGFLGPGEQDTGSQLLAPLQQERTELGGEPINGEQQFPHVPDYTHPPGTSGNLCLQPLSTTEGMDGQVGSPSPPC